MTFIWIRLMPRILRWAHIAHLLNSVLILYICYLCVIVHCWTVHMLLPPLQQFHWIFCIENSINQPLHDLIDWADLLLVHCVSTSLKTVVQFWYDDYSLHCCSFDIFARLYNWVTVSWLDCWLQLSAGHSNYGRASQVLSAGDGGSSSWYYNTVW